MGDTSSDTASANVVAVQKAFDALPDTGGLVAITDELYIDSPIIFPHFSIATNPFRKNLTLAGLNPGRSKIIQLSNDWAVFLPLTQGLVQLGDTAYAASTSWWALRYLTVISAGSGVSIAGGGKRIWLSNLVIARCRGDYGLHISGMNGGVLSHVYLHKNANVGARLENVSMLTIDTYGSAL